MTTCQQQHNELGAHILHIESMCADILTALNLVSDLLRGESMPELVQDSGTVQDSGYYNWLQPQPAATVRTYSADDVEPFPEVAKRHIRDLEERVAHLEAVVHRMLNEGESQ